MKQINLIGATPMWKTLEKFGIYIAIGVVLFFGFQGIFGSNGALALIREANAVKQAQMTLILEEMRSINAQQKVIMEEVKVVKDFQEAARQQMGTFSRKEYHPAMKRIKKGKGDELLKETHRYNAKLGLPH